MQNVEPKITSALPILIATAIASAFGVGKLFMAVHVLSAMADIVPADGYRGAFLLRSADALIGAGSLIAGLGFLFRKHWGRSLLEAGALPAAFYEIGRGLSMATYNPEASSLRTLTELFLYVTSITIAWWCTKTDAAKRYVEHGP